MSEIKQITLSTDSAIAYERNSRTHSDHQIEQVIKSIQEFGFTNPVLIDENNVLIAGHGRTEAARRMGLKEIPALQIMGLSEEQKKALRIADNKIAENAKWDWDALMAEISDLRDLNFDLELTGFDGDELVRLCNELDKTEAIEGTEEGTEEDTDTDTEEDTEIITKVGDMWALGAHRVICGDCTDPNVLNRLFDTDKADIWITDPPYGVGITADYYSARHNLSNRIFGSRAGNGRFQVQRGVANDDKSPKELADFFLRAESAANAHLAPGAACYVFCSEILLAGVLSLMLEPAPRYSRMYTLVWDKARRSYSRPDYKPAHELIAYFWKLGAGHHWYSDQKQSSVITGYNPPVKSELHPTMKPVPLIEYILTNSSKSGDLVFDGFLGSGTTLIAADNLGRRCYGVELDPLYVSRIIRRWEQKTGGTAELIAG